jgi:CDP-glycerol glycerophosphotransferase (TagB/SpsB family)
VTLAHSLLRADVVVALSTSAEIEAAIADRPVVTFRAGADAPGQEGLLHFRYLLEERGGHVIDSADLDEHIANLARVLQGDYDRARIRDFVERFVRPAGVAQPVSPTVASTVLELVTGRKPQTAYAR